MSLYEISFLSPNHKVVKELVFISYTSHLAISRQDTHFPSLLCYCGTFCFLYICSLHLPFSCLFIFITWVFSDHSTQNSSPFPAFLVIQITSSSIIHVFLCWTIWPMRIGILCSLLVYLMPRTSLSYGRHTKDFH